MVTFSFGAHSNAGVGAVCACTGNDGGTGCNLIGCFAQSFGAGGKKLCKKTIPSSDTISFFKKRASYYVADGSGPEPRETPCSY